MKSIGFLIFCLIFGFLLFRREKTALHPFIDLSLFRHPIYRAVNISIFAIQFVLMITVYRAIFFQDALGWTPLKSGTISFISSFPVLFMSPIGGWLADRYGSKLPISVGFCLLIYSFFWLAFFIQSSMGILLLGLFAFGIGIPLVFTPSYSSAMGAIPPKKAGTAFGVIATTRSFSASFGVAIIGTFVNYIQMHSFQNLAWENSKTSGVSSTLLERFVVGIKSAKASLSDQQVKILSTYYKDSQIEGFFYIHLMIGFALILALAFVFVLYHRKASHQPPQTPAEGWD